MYQRGRLQSFWLDKGDAYDFEFTSEHEWKPLYTTPPAQPAPVQETPFQIGQRLRQEGKGISDLWGAVSSDADMPEAQRGFDSAAQPAPVQEPVAWRKFNGFRFDYIEHQQALSGMVSKEWKPLYDTTPPAAQRQWVGLTEEEMYLNCPNWLSQEQCKVWIQQIEAKLKEKNAAAQPAVPDAIHHTDLSESLEYIQGWNDCRQAMLEMMK
jgi:hypothetical protein